MDSSDGLSTTLNEMANQSKCKFIINNIPTGNDLLKFAKFHKIDPDDLVFHGGEEYEFVFTASKEHISLIKKNASLLKIHVIEIGYVTNGKGVFLENQGKYMQLKDLGWHHFKK
jgi:thiamine-monophosphate kinase